MDGIKGLDDDGAIVPNGPAPLHYQDFTIALRHTTFGGTPLDE
jgi:hypothetical protein